MYRKNESCSLQNWFWKHAVKVNISIYMNKINKMIINSFMAQFTEREHVPPWWSICVISTSIHKTVSRPKLRQCMMLSTCNWGLSFYCQTQEHVRVSRTVLWCIIKTDTSLALSSNGTLNLREDDIKMLAAVTERIYIHVYSFLW